MSKIRDEIHFFLAFCHFLLFIYDSNESIGQRHKIYLKSTFQKMLGTKCIFMARRKWLDGKSPKAIFWEIFANRRSLPSFLFWSLWPKVCKTRKKNLGQTQRDLHDSSQFAMLMKISKIDVFTFCDFTHWYSYENVNFTDFHLHGKLRRIVTVSIQSGQDFFILRFAYRRRPSILF
jgi:hypothetical protein